MQTIRVFVLFTVLVLVAACASVPAPGAPDNLGFAPLGTIPEGTGQAAGSLSAPMLTAPVTATAASTATMVPLKDAVASMDPQDAWQNFYDLTQIPRPSHHEEQVRDFLVKVGQNLGLETIVDNAGIRKCTASSLKLRLFTPGWSAGRTHQLPVPERWS